jgi:hypothetical protein
MIIGSKKTRPQLTFELMEITYRERQVIIVSEEECKGIAIDRFNAISDIVPLITSK